MLEACHKLFALDGGRVLTGCEHKAALAAIRLLDVVLFVVSSRNFEAHASR